MWRKIKFLRVSSFKINLFTCHRVRWQQLLLACVAQHNQRLFFGFFFPQGDFCIKEKHNFNQQHQNLWFIKLVLRISRCISRASRRAAHRLMEKRQLQDLSNKKKKTFDIKRVWAAGFYFIPPAVSDLFVSWGYTERVFVWINAAKKQKYDVGEALRSPSALFCRFFQQSVVYTHTPAVKSDMWAFVPCLLMLKIMANFTTLLCELSLNVSNVKYMFVVMKVSSNVMFLKILEWYKMCIFS